MTADYKIRSLLARRYAEGYSTLLTPSEPLISFIEQGYTTILPFQPVLNAIDHVAISTTEADRIIQKIISFLPALYNLELLLVLLIKDKRLQLITLIFKHLYQLLCQRLQITNVSIESSHELSMREKERLLSFLENKIKYRLKPIFTVNPRLIAGIRVQGDSFLWERSVSHRLKELSHLLVL